MADPTDSNLPVLEATYDAMGNQTGFADAVAAQANASPDYVRQKILEFQAMLDSLDGLYFTLQEVGAAVSTTGDQDAYTDWLALVNEFESKRGLFKTAAEGINLASNGANSLGANLPALNIPPGLGIAPLVVAAGVLAGTYVLVQWGNNFIDKCYQAFSNWQNLTAIAALPPDQQGAVLQAFQKAQADAQAAKDKANGSGITAFADLAKYALWIGAGFLIWKIWRETQ